MREKETGREREREREGDIIGVNLTNIQYKHIHKSHNESPVQLMNTHENISSFKLVLSGIA
jgi:hypothetical protein